MATQALMRKATQLQLELADAVEDATDNFASHALLKQPLTISSVKCAFSAAPPGISRPDFSNATNTYSLTMVKQYDAACVYKVHIQEQPAKPTKPVSVKVFSNGLVHTLSLGFPSAVQAVEHMLAQNTSAVPMDALDMSVVSIKLQLRLRHRLDLCSMLNALCNTAWVADAVMNDLDVLDILTHGVSIHRSGKVFVDAASPLELQTSLDALLEVLLLPECQDCFEFDDILLY